MQKVRRPKLWQSFVPTKLQDGEASRGADS